MRERERKNKTVKKLEKKNKKAEKIAPSATRTCAEMLPMVCSPTPYTLGHGTLQITVSIVSLIYLLHLCKRNRIFKKISDRKLSKQNQFYAPNILKTLFEKTDMIISKFETYLCVKLAPAFLL